MINIIKSNSYKYLGREKQVNTFFIIVLKLI